jgi:LPXTG-site transpeptidase (sortase) family protein
MKLKILSKQKSFIFIFSVLVFSLGFVLVFTTSTTAFYKKDPVTFGIPVRLKIPKINIDAPIESVGLTLLGAVDVPKGPSDAAWFNLGARPGEVGSSILDGHSGWKNNIPAVFDSLYKLKKGDKIYTVDDKGVTVAFVVREVKSYAPNVNAPEVFNLDDKKAHLNLITCFGTWNAVKKSHSERLVVFTDREK